MGGNVNFMEIIGNLGEEPKLYNADASKQPMCTGRIAANESWNDKSTGEKKKRTTWFNFVLFGETAVNFHKYNHKGAYLRVVGDFREDTYLSNLKAYKSYNADGTPTLLPDGTQFVSYVQVERTQLKLHVKDWTFLSNKENSNSAYAGAAATPQTVGTVLPAGQPVVQQPVVQQPVVQQPGFQQVDVAPQPQMVAAVDSNQAVVQQPVQTNIPQFAVNSMPQGV